MEAEDDAIEAAMKLRSGVVGEPPTASANLQAQTSSVVACQDSRETSQLADGEVEILSEHIALLDEAALRREVVAGMEAAKRLT